MKKIGIIGGVGPESTVIYYQLIIKRYREKFNTKDCPSLLINSINMMHMARLLANNQLNEVVDFLSAEINTLEQAGITHGAITANTPHIVFDEVQSRTKIKLISIVEETCKFIRASNATHALLLGTRTTMSGGFYNEVAAKHDLVLVTPDAGQQDYIQDKYVNEFLFNDIRPDTKKELIRIVRDIQSKSSIQGIILGGTELPLILNQQDFNDVRVFDTAQIHVESIVNLYT